MPHSVMPQGVERAVLREVQGGKKVPLRGPETVLGRDPTCDVVVAHEETSRRHARVFRSGTGFQVEDLGSANGTFVNGERVQQPRQLKLGDRIELGTWAATFEEEGPTLADPPDAESTLRHGPREDQPVIRSSLDVAGGIRVEVAAEAKLRAVLEIARSLGAALDLDEVLPKILGSLFTLFPQADRGIILLRDPATAQLMPKATHSRRPQTDGVLPISRTILQHVVSTRQAVLTADASSDHRFDPSQSIGRLRLRSVLCVPMLSQEGACLGVIQLDSENPRTPFREEDLDVLASAATQAARAVELAALHRELRELESAAQIQKSFLPRDRPHVDQVAFFDHYQAAQQVGGDYYDYIPLPGNRLAVALGDVSGKGVSAALLMARLSAGARVCLAACTDLPAAVRQLNILLTRVGLEDRFVTFVVGVLDPADFTLTLVNAGHLPPLRRRADGTVEEVGEEKAGLPLGVFDRPYEAMTITLEPGDTVALYTDGVTEARDPAGTLYGLPRLKTVIAAAPPGAEPVGRAVLSDVEQYAAGRPFGDDLTVVCFSRQ